MESGNLEYEDGKGDMGAVFSEEITSELALPERSDKTVGR